MSQPFVVLNQGETARLAGMDVGSLTLVSGSVAFSDQEHEGRVLKAEARTDVAKKGDVVLVGLAPSSRVIAHADRRPR